LFEGFTENLKQLITYAYVYNAYSDSIEKQTISMVGSCREFQWVQSKSTTARSAADH